jgi:hypothetical protein
MWIIRITPYLFCNSIQESNNSVFESRSYTHVLIQEKVYASKLNTKLILSYENRIPKGLFWMDRFKTQRRREKHQDMCVQVMRKQYILGLYIY